MRLALLAAKDLVGGQIDIVRETHGGWLGRGVGGEQVSAEALRCGGKQQECRFRDGIEAKAEIRGRCKTQV